MDIQIGLSFAKRLSKGKTCKCEVIDIVERVSTKTGKIIGIEYWAKSDEYGMGQSFEVAKNTILRGV